MVTVRDSPAAKDTRSNPRSTRGGSPADAGKPRYSCATSVPARAPVFRSVKSTASEPAVLPAWRARLE
jgi:hypothetical protein